MHRLSTSSILGYHGRSQKVGERWLAGEPFQPGNNEYDWLGPGIYFSESNPQRGIELARESAARKTAGQDAPFVMAAIIELGLCYDLATTAGIEWVKLAHLGLKERVPPGHGLPPNSTDGLRRNLHCAVIRWPHKITDDGGMQPIDPRRGVFIEGEPLYPGAGFYAKTHIQIVVRNPNCIQGVFHGSPNQMPAL